MRGSCEQKRNRRIAASSGFMIAEAERRFPVRVQIGVPPAGLGLRLDRIKTWLDENAGADGWAMTPSGTRGVLNDALSIYFGDPTLELPSSLDGAQVIRSRPLEASSRCARTNRRHVSGPRCIGHRNGCESPDRLLECSRQADQSRDDANPVLAPLSLDPRCLRGHFIDAAANGRLDIEPPSNCIEKHLRSARRQI